MSSWWRGLTSEQRAAWSLSASSQYILTHNGQRVPLNGYNYFMSVSSKRVNLGLPRSNMPPAEPTFSPNPVGQLVATNTGGNVTLKVRVPVAPAPLTVVQAAVPASAGARCVQHFPILGLLPPPIDGWSDITDLYVARYGVPPAGMVVHIRTRQYIDGWSDVSKPASAPVPAPA